MALDALQPGPTCLFIDNMAALCVINEKRPTPRARHINIQHLPSKNDMRTKILSWSIFLGFSIPVMISPNLLDGSCMPVMPTMAWDITKLAPQMKLLCPPICLPLEWGPMKPGRLMVPNSRVTYSVPLPGQLPSGTTCAVGAPCCRAALLTLPVPLTCQAVTGLLLNLIHLAQVPQAFASLVMQLLMCLPKGTSALRQGQSWFQLPTST